MKTDSPPRPQFVGLRRLSYLTGVPAVWLREQAEAGALPYLTIGRRRLFDPAAVTVVLGSLAAQARKAGPHG